MLQNNLSHIIGTNLPAPINTSSEEQTKKGDLTVEGNFTTGGLKMTAGTDNTDLMAFPGQLTLTYREGVGSLYGFNLVDQADNSLFLHSEEAAQHQVLYFGDGNPTNNVFGISTQAYDGDWNPRFVVNQDGTVGIGTASPGTKLEINGNTEISGVSPTLLLSMKNAETGSIKFHHEDLARDDWQIYEKMGAGSAQGSLNIKDVFSGGGNVLTFKPGGNVGIGKTNPEAKLHIFAPMAAIVNALEIEASGELVTSNRVRIGFKTSHPGCNPAVIGAIDSINPFSTSHNGELAFSTAKYSALSEKMRINRDGDIGIGTTAPSEKLHVVGNIYKTGTVSFVEDYPNDPSKQIVYVSLEGPEVGTYIRGTAACQDNEAIIIFPDHFRLVTSENGLTAQLTPRLQSMNLFTKELTNEKLVVGCDSDTSFDYFVNGLRKGYENHQVVRQK